MPGLAPRQREQVVSDTKHALNARKPVPWLWRRPGSRQAVYALRGPDLQSEVQLAQLMQQQLVALTHSSSHAGKPLLLGRAAAAAAATTLQPQSDGAGPLPLLRHLLQCLPPEPPLDLRAAAVAAAVVEAASPAAGGRGRAFKAPRLAATGGEPYSVLLFAAYTACIHQLRLHPLSAIWPRGYVAFPHAVLTLVWLAVST